MTHEQLVQQYLTAVQESDLDAVLALFSTAAMVHSPLYGSMLAKDFYPTLFADSGSSTLTLRSTMEGTQDGRPVIGFWFDFDWVLATGEPAPFTVVDVAEIGPHGLIDDLHIVYDTAPIREAFGRRRS